MKIYTGKENVYVCKIELDNFTVAFYEYEHFLNDTQHRAVSLQQLSSFFNYAKSY